MAAAMPGALTALAFHDASIGLDENANSQNMYYSGVSVQRYDDTFVLQGNSDCNVDFGGNYVAYESQWVQINEGVGAFVELGTAHKTCKATGAEVKFWYAFLGLPDGSLHALWTHAVGNGLHRFFLTNGSDGFWRWYIDQTLVYQYGGGNLGYEVQAGLESYDPNPPSIPRHTYMGLVEQLNWGNWVSWSTGALWATFQVDNYPVTGSPPMWGNLYSSGGMSNNGYACEAQTPCSPP